MNEYLCDDCQDTGEINVEPDDSFPCPACRQRKEEDEANWSRE